MNFDEKINKLNESLSTCQKELDNIIDETVLTGIRNDVELVDTNIGYLGFIPSHWKIEKVKYHLSRKSDKNHPDAEVLSLYRELGVVPKNSRDDNHNVTSEDTSKYQFVKIGDFVINKMKAWQGSMAVSGFEGIVSPAYYIYDFKDDTFDKNYFHYLIRNKALTTEFRRLSGGIREGQWDLPEEAMNNLLLPVPPIEEQKEIADYLDKKCAEIDDVIGDIKAQIETLKSMKQSCITEVITQGLNPNTEYRESGVEWLGKIPSHWKIMKVKDGFYIKKSKALQEDPVVLSLARSGVKVRDITTNEGQLASSYYEYNPVDIDDLLLNPMDLQSGANCSISKVQGVISPAYVNLRYKKGFNPQFFDYYFKLQYWSFAFFSYGKGVSFDNRWTLNSETLMRYPIVVPPIEEQKEIADYLDKKCAEIDDVIGDIKAQIETLKSMKQSCITEVITQGLNPNTEYRESGVEWLGKIPSHWKIMKVKDGFYIKKSKALQEDPVVLSLARSGVKVRDITTNEGQLASSYYEYNPVDIDDLLLNPMDLQSGANCSISKVQGVISPAYVNLRYKKGFNPQFFDYYFKLQYWSFAFFSYGKGVSFDNRWTLNSETLMRYPIVVPPIEEQKEIADYLDKKCAEIDDVIGDKEKQLGVLEEYKKSLIFEVVTGKREVL